MTNNKEASNHATEPKEIKENIDEYPINWVEFEDNLDGDKEVYFDTDCWSKR